MTEWIYGWMKGLAFFFIFMTAVLNCLPDQKYRKYVRFFSGNAAADSDDRPSAGAVPSG